ncbi:MAG: CsbD family protein [Caldilineaceae bacterium]
MMIRGKLRQARGGLKAEWGRLTEDDRRMLDGKIDQLVGLFQERYGYTQERAAAALEHYLGGRAKKPAGQTGGHCDRQPIGCFIGTGFRNRVAVAGWFTLPNYSLKSTGNF